MKTLRFSLVASALVGLGLVLGHAQPVFAQTAQRTFVSTAGNDANLCSAALPCRTFGVALTHTSPGGEIVALDSGGYGPVTIGQPVTIVGAPGAHVAITAFSGNAITVAAGSSDKVILRNLYLNGQGGSFGIQFSSGASLHIENVVAHGFTSAGINVNTSGNSHTFIADTIARNNAMDGIKFTAGSGATARASIVRTRAEKNTSVGFFAFDRSIVDIRDSVSADNGFGFGAEATAEMTIEHSSATTNSTAGIAVEIAPATILVSNTTITHNGTGVQMVMGSGSVLSRGNNTLTRNGTDGTFTGTVAAQ